MASPEGGMNRREFLRAGVNIGAAAIAALGLAKSGKMIDDSDKAKEKPEKAEGEKRPGGKPEIGDKMHNPEWVALNAQKRFLERLNGGDFENIYKGGAKKLAEILDEKLSHSVESDMTPEVKEKVKTGINLWFQKFKDAHPDDWTSMQLIDARDAWVGFLEEQLEQFDSNSPDIQPPKL